MIRTRPNPMSAKKLAAYQAEHGRKPFSSITGKRKAVKRKSGKQRRVMGREKLYGAAKTEQRWKLFVRSGGSRETGLGGYCEAYLFTEGPLVMRVRCFKPITWETMEWSHNRHAANKDDSLEGGIASCRECHQKSHNAGGKPCPSKKV